MAHPATDNFEHPVTGEQAVLDRLESLSPERIDARLREIRRQIRSNGVVHGASVTEAFESRPWQLDLQPRVIRQDEWNTLSKGLIQRTRLRSALFRDLYSSRELILENIVPANGIFAHRGYLREAHGIPCPEQLPIYSIDVARSDNGDWQVIGDSPDSLEGCGYALENRHVLSRVLATLFRTQSVARIGQFLARLQYEVLESLDPDARCVLLAQGSKDTHILEYSYLAKHLGCTLVFLNDLVVRDRRVWLKTVEGLQRVDTIVRFVGDHQLDPLIPSANMTNEGIPGLLSAIRSGNVRLINPPGVTVLANPVFDVYHSELCRFYLNEEACLMPPKTYWLGDQAMHNEVMSSVEDFDIQKIDDNSIIYQPATMSNLEKRELNTTIDRQPGSYTARVRPSWYQEHEIENTTSSLTTQPMTIRTFLSGFHDNYHVMPGGLGILGRPAPGMTVPGKLNGLSQQERAEQKCRDLWIVQSPQSGDSNDSGNGNGHSNGITNNKADSNLPNHFPHDTPPSPSRINTPITAASNQALPSRFAENLFWFGRYTERAENMLRLLRTTLQQFQSDDLSYDPSSQRVTATGPAVTSLLKALTNTTGTFPGFVGDGADKRLSNPDEELLTLIRDIEKPGSLFYTLNQLQFSADEIRERISPDLFRFLNELDDQTKELPGSTRTNRLIEDSEQLNNLIQLFNQLLGILAAITGLTHENFTRGDGWRFIELGRRIERARFATTLLHTTLRTDCFMQPGQFSSNEVLLENLLQVFDSIMTYRNRYRGELTLSHVLSLLLLDESNPRSVGFQFRALEKEVLKLPRTGRAHAQHPLWRLSTAGLSQIRLVKVPALLNANNIETQQFSSILQQLESIPAELANGLAANYFNHTEIRNTLGTQIQPL